MQVLDVERRLERIERLLRAAADEARSARIDLGLDHDGGGERWARMMFGVLDQLDREGGEVRGGDSSRSARSTPTTIVAWRASTSSSSNRPPEFRTRLTKTGRERLRFLRERYGTWTRRVVRHDDPRSSATTAGTTWCRSPITA